MQQHYIILNWLYLFLILHLLIFDFELNLMRQTDISNPYGFPMNQSMHMYILEHPSRTCDMSRVRIPPNYGSSVFSLKITGCFGCMHLPCIILHVQYDYIQSLYTCNLHLNLHASLLHLWNAVPLKGACKNQQIYIRVGTHIIQ